jgi:hypothetical protein
MLTLVVKCEKRVRFILTKHPQWRFDALRDEMPCEIEMMGVTLVKAKDIKLQFANNHHHGLWYTLDEKLQAFLSEIFK